jgi:hypothetical protein
MWEQQESRLIGIIKPIFPPGTEIRRGLGSNGLVLNVGWKLKNDPARPNKRSRRIILAISEEALEDYHSDSDARDKRIASVIADRLKTFTPDHDTPYGQPEPEEVWVLM